MKKTFIAMIVATMTFTLCACGTETTGSMTITETDTEQTVKQDISTEQTNSEDSNTEKQNTAEATTTSEISKAQQSQAKKESFTELDIDPSWKDVAELVNLKGDETTVYLLADGRYMDRTSIVYIYDGGDTWTDESGVEWNEVVK